MPTKSLVGLTALMLAAFAVLIGLGVWQLQRLHWKEGLIAEIETRTKGEPISLDQAIAIAREGRDPSYYRVKVEGRFDHAKELYLYAVSEGRAGWHVITPLKTEDGEVVLIDRGFVPDELRNPASRAAGRARAAWSPSPASCGSRKLKAPSPPIMRSEPIAGSGATCKPWRARSGAGEVAPFYP